MLTTAGAALRTTSAKDNSTWLIEVGTTRVVSSASAAPAHANAATRLKPIAAQAAAHFSFSMSMSMWPRPPSRKLRRPHSRANGPASSRSYQRSCHPGAARIRTVAERLIGGVDQRLATIVEQESGAHLVHRIAEAHP